MRSTQLPYSTFQENCLNCDSTCQTWPWCVRGGTCKGTESRICYSKLCSKCTGYEKNACNGLPSSVCWNSCTYCSSAFKCLEPCPQPLVLIEDLCINLPYKYTKGSLDPVIYLKEFTSSSTYDNIFASTKKNKLLLVPTKSRGLYFNTGALKSNESIFLNTKNTIVAWLKAPWKLFQIWNHPSIIFSSNGRSSIMLSNTETWHLARSYPYTLIDNQWAFYALINDFDSEIETFYNRVYINNEILSQFSSSGYALYQLNSPTYIFGTGFLYSLQVFNYANYDILAEYENSACIPNKLSNCLSDCEITAYPLNSTCENCQVSNTENCESSECCLIPQDINEVSGQTY